jgi:hypothetical protein
VLVESLQLYTSISSLWGRAPKALYLCEAGRWRVQEAALGVSANETLMPDPDRHVMLPTFGARPARIWVSGFLGELLSSVCM